MKCGWKNIFWADQGEPTPQLIASFHSGEYVCPACREDWAGRRMILMAAVPYSVLLDDDLEVMDAEMTIPNSLTPREHLRALVRWVGPWDEEVQSSCFVTAGLYSLIVLISLLLGHRDIVAGVLGLAWWGIKLYLAWKMVITLLVRQRRLIWRQMATEPLYSRSLRRRREIRYLRNQGYSWREARKGARW